MPEVENCQSDRAKTRTFRDWDTLRQHTVGSRDVLGMIGGARTLLVLPLLGLG